MAPLLGIEKKRIKLYWMDCHEKERVIGGGGCN